MRAILGIMNKRFTKVISFILLLIISILSVFYYLLPSHSIINELSFVLDDQNVIDTLLIEDLYIRISRNKFIIPGDTSQIKAEIKFGSPNKKNKVDITYNDVIIKARLELPGVDIFPGYSFSQLINRNGNKFTWDLLFNKVGKYTGRIWIYIVDNDKTNNNFEEYAIFVKDIEMDCIYPLLIPKDIVCYLIIFLFSILIFINGIYVISNNSDINKN